MELPISRLRICPAMNIVIQVVGSRGDVQPFIALGGALQKYGHRVRLATHSTFASFVRESGLEFYDIGGSPEDLMSYMVQNPGLFPSLRSICDGEISRKRRMVEEMLQGCWRSCFEPDEISCKPFMADAIIANPPGFAHVHCGQALGIPVHMMFTMPWTPTRAFPHPLTNMKSGRIDMKMSSSHYMSYGMVDYMTWQGLGDVINRWRRNVLGLETLPESVGSELLDVAQVPYTYCWSPTLIPKPEDWGPNIDVCGFFLRPEPSYTPSSSLAAFLDKGPPPIYVGFGSIVIDDTESMNSMVLEACRLSGVRVIISRGWSKLGGSNPATDNVFYVDDCPHEWLFKRVAAVVHHGGAGTTACGLFNARPTVVVPFFGDVVAAKGAGPNPIPHTTLTVDNLTSAIKFCLKSEVLESSQAIASQMRQERGVDKAVESFHKHLPVDALTCDLIPGNIARWQCQPNKHRARQTIKLSDAAMATLMAEKEIKKLEVNPWDPLSAGTSSLIDTWTDIFFSIGEIATEPYKEFKRVRIRTGKRSASLHSAAAVGRGLKNMGGALVKGTFVNLPIAVTEGFRNAPRLIGDSVENLEKVTSWRSGCRVAVNNFGNEVYRGITGFVMKPMEGAKQGGTIGLLKGVSRGSLGLVTKPGSGEISAPCQNGDDLMTPLIACNSNIGPYRISCPRRAP
ncbi:hypothetical protein CI238_11671 [Colletotrichum incanum]|uniref:Uncharacterized protein n=1 Tax=Colletotrichum incanum TaxID=1573173 RepID=A0A167BEY4_COLIC|nr:hypothetical protein CI238_11671 [Colletotrichum incanum]